MLKKVLSMVIASAIAATCFASLSAVLADEPFDPNFGTKALAAYDFENNGTGVYADKAGSNNATTGDFLGFGTAAIVDAKHGKGYKSANHRSLINGSALRGVTDVTVMMYAKIDYRNTGWTALMTIGSGQNNNMYNWSFADQREGETNSLSTGNAKGLRFELNANGVGAQTMNNRYGNAHGASGNSALVGDNKYHLITMTQEGNTLNMYVDGTRVGYRTVGANQKIGNLFKTEADDVMISLFHSYGHNDSPVGGIIDDFRIYNRALSSTEVTTTSWNAYNGTGDLSAVPTNGLLYNFSYDADTIVDGKVKNLVTGEAEQEINKYKVKEVAGATGDGALYWDTKTGNEREMVGANFDYPTMKTAGEVTFSTYFKTDSPAMRGDRSRQFLFEVSPLETIIGHNNDLLGRRNYALAVIFDNRLKFEVKANNAGSDIWTNGIEFSEGYHLLTVTQKNNGETNIYVDGALVQSGTMANTIFGFEQSAIDAGVKVNLGSNSIWGGERYNEEGLGGTLDAFRAYKNVLTLDEIKALSNHYSNSGAVGGQRFGFDRAAEPTGADVLATVNISNVGVVADTGSYAERAVQHANGTITSKVNNSFIWNFNLTNQQALIDAQAGGAKLYAKILYMTAGSAVADDYAALTGAFRDSGGIPNPNGLDIPQLGHFPNITSDGFWKTAVIEINVTSATANEFINFWNNCWKTRLTIGGWLVISTNTDPLTVPPEYKNVPNFTKPAVSSANFTVWSTFGDYDGVRRDDVLTQGVYPDGSVSYKNFDNEITWNGYADRGQFQRHEDFPRGNIRFKTGETYYLKTFVKGNYLSDPTRRPNVNRDFQPYENNLFVVREPYEKVHLGVGSADPKFEGVWQSVVVPYTMTDAHLNWEGAYYNSCFGDTYFAQIAPFIVISSDDKPLQFPTTFTAPEYTVANRIGVLETSPEAVTPSLVTNFRNQYNALSEEGKANIAYSYERLLAAELAVEAQAVKTGITNGLGGPGSKKVKLQAEYSYNNSGGFVTNDADRDNDGTGSIGGVGTDGTWLSYDRVDFKDGVEKVSVRYSCGVVGYESGSYVEFRVGSRDAEPFATVGIPFADWSDFVEVSADVTDAGITGMQTVFVTLKKPTDNPPEFIGDFNWFGITYTDPKSDLREIVAADKELLEQLRTDYDALSADAKALITNLEWLEEAESKIDQAIANEVIDMIAEFGEVDDADVVTIADDFSLESKEAVEAARAAYEALTPVQQALVDNYAVLEAAEEKIDELTADVVEAMIAEFGTMDDANVVTLVDGFGMENADAVLAARAAYDDLTPAQKAFVDNLPVLEAAEAAIKDDIIAQVEAAIDAIPENLVYGGDAEIKAARELFDALSDDWKAEVSNAADLTAAETAYQALIDAMIEEVEDAIDDLPAVGDITLDDKEEIEAARKLYEDLPDELKEDVTNLDVLVEAEKALGKLRLAGDANGDGEVDGADATAVLRYVNRASNKPNINLSNSNVNQDFDDDGKDIVDGADATIILRYVNRTSNKPPLK